MPSLVYRLPSITERISLAEIFSHDRPLELELGSGDGSFLIEYARRHPQKNFLGVERLLGRLRKIDRRAQRAGLSNLWVISIEASYFVQFLLPPQSVTALHVYFPDPWPKRRHHKNRLIDAGFVECVRKALKPGGTVHLRTDNRHYFDQMNAAFSAGDAFQPILPPEELVEVFTDFEREFQAAGVATLRASYRLEGGC